MADIVAGSTKEQFDAAREKIRGRFTTAQNNPRTPTAEDRAEVDELTFAAIHLATLIEMYCPEGRNKSLALTHLEDTLTRANKAIYVDVDKD